MVYLISQGDTTVIYVFLSLFILFMSAVHSKPIQYYISLGVVGGVLLTNSIILSRLLSSGDITQIELIAHVEAMLYVIVNIVLAFVFVTIVEQEILKSKKLVEMSTVDFLLKAHQRREKDKIKVVERNDKTSVLLVGIDHYSKINDEKGNETGDAILNEVIQVIRRTVRVDDYIVRWNMDDFLIILHYTPLSNAGIVAEKIRTVIEKNEFQSMKGKVTVTITAASSEEKETMHKAIEQAELLLKKTKDTHHNYVHIDYETK
jgi:diguanylate cyclase (GGDEF)-like protein